MEGKFCMNKEIWKNPKMEQSLDEAQVPLWFWNDKLEDQELIRQMELKTGIGVKCTNPHARTNNGDGFIGTYLDEEWFHHIQTVLDYKKEHGEKMWLYDEIDWPAGSCGKTITKDENNREHYIEIERVEIPAGTVWRTQLLRFEGTGLFGIRDKESLKDIPLNVVITDAETGEPYDPTDYTDFFMFGPELEFQSDRDAAAYLVTIRVDPYNAGGDEQVNYLDGEVTGKFLKSTYDKYAEHIGDAFGREVTSVFNDETRVCHAIPWTGEFPAVFQQRHGYDIRREIYKLIIPGVEAGRVRMDYYDTVAYLFQTRYLGEIHTWCEKHDLKLFAHLLGEETLFGHVRYSGDYMRLNRYQDIAGADYLGKGIGSLNIKFTSAAAHSYGKKRTAVEVFAGCGWDLTFDEYTRMITWMFQNGMQIIINHGFFYSTRGNRKNDWPPSQFFQWKYWDRQSEGNDMIRRLQYAFADGTNEMDVLAYMPTESMMLHYLPDQHFTHAFFRGALLRDEKAVRIDTETQKTLNALISANLDFDMVHRDAVENFAVKNGKIINKLTGQQFACLVLPMCEVLPLSMARICRDFAGQGGRIILAGDTPVMGLSGEEDEEVRSIFCELLENGSAIRIEAGDEKRASIVEAVREAVPHPVVITSGTNGTVNNHPCYPPYLIDPYMHGGEDIKGVLFTRYQKDGRRNTLFMNYNDEPETVEAEIETAGDVPEVWDSLTGEIKEAETVQKTDKGYKIRLHLPCSHGIVVVSSL